MTPKFLSAAALAASLALAPGPRAMAQDELPKDAPPPLAKGVAPSEPSTRNGAAPTGGAVNADQLPAAPPPGTMIDQPWAVLQALDKITARVRRLPIKVGQSGAFGTLLIEVDACRKAPPEDAPESAAFLKITDRQANAAQLVFDGWMFASSPALSAMDNPVYDIWVVDCAAEPVTSSAASPAPTSAGAH